MSPLSLLIETDIFSDVDDVGALAIAAVVGSFVVPAVLRMRAVRSTRDAPSAG